MRTEIRSLLNFIIALAAVLVVVGILGACVESCHNRARAADAGKTDTEWSDAWKGRGDAYKSPGEGVDVGTSWCLKDSQRCKEGILKRLEKRWDRYCPDPTDLNRCWWRKYAGGMVPAHLALTSATEAPAGPAQCSPDKNLKECGLLGITWAQAEKCGCNTCDPECAIACAGHMANAKRMKMLELFPDLYKAPTMDRYIMAGMGGIGTPLWKVLLDHSGALALRESGAPRHDYPYLRVLVWYKSPRAKPKTDKALALHAAVSSYRIGIRISRAYAGMQILMAHYGVIEPSEYKADLTGYSWVATRFDELPWGGFREVKIPGHLPPYPGKAKHGKCHLWPDLIKKTP